MIITCEQCQTQFQLDDSRIPERGARVRCSRCEHAFFVKPPSEAGDSVENAVEQALSEDEEQRSGSTQELDPAVALRGEAEEESDWKFNDDESGPGARSHGCARGGGRSARGCRRSAVTGTRRRAARRRVGFGRGPRSRAWTTSSIEGLVADLGQDVDDEIDSLLDSTGYSDELEELEPAAAGLEEPAAVPAEPKPEVLIAAEEREALIAVPTADQAAEEELGSPENWDFFADEPDGPLSEETGFERTPIGQLGLVPEPMLERPPIDVDAEPAQAGHRLRQLAHVAGWLSVALLVLGGLHGGIVAQRAGPVALRTAQTAGGLETTGVEGRWLDNAVAGPIYVISGELLRAGSRPAVPGAWLAVRLFDENGVLLVEKAAVVGPALPEARLREENPRELRAAQAQGARAMAEASLVPGDAWAFQAILSDLPPAASRFDLAAMQLKAAPPAPEVP